MKRHKNLERAIVLGLILSTGIYGTTFAEKIWGENLDKVVEEGDLEVNDSGTAVGFDGKIDVKNGNLIITAGSNGIESGYVSEAQLNILANGVEIKSNKNGIFTATEEGHSGKVIIGSEEKKIDYLRIDSKGQGIDNKSGEVRIYGNEDSNIIIHSTGSQGIFDRIKSAINNGKDIVEISGGNISLIADNGYGIVNDNDAKETIINSNITQITASRNGIENRKGDTSIKGKDVRIKAGKNAVHNSGTGTINIMYPENTQEDISTLDNQSKYNVILIGEEKNGILSDGAGTTNVKAYDDTIIAGKENGILSNKNGQINVTAGNNNYIGQYTDEKGKEYTSQNGMNVSNGTVRITSNNENKIYGTQNGILATGKNNDKDNVNIDVELLAKTNFIQAGDVFTGYGTDTAIKAVNNSNVKLVAENTNQLLGTVHAEGEKANVTLNAKNNVIRSTAHDKDTGHEDLVSALYVNNKGKVDVVAKDEGYNFIASSYKNIGENGAERTVWAQHGGKINIEGKTFIIAENSDKNTGIVGGDGHEQEGNSIGIAIAAGTGTITDGNGNILDEYKDKDGSLADRTDEERSKVELNYKGDKNGLNSYIKGDIVSGYGGLIDIKKVNDTTGGIDIQGNGLAANGGKLNIDLGNGGTWIGRADDYGDAGYGEDAKYHQNFYNPAFSNEIIEGGTVTLKMGDNSTWYVNGQSWITNVNTEEANNATIDLVKANTDKNETAHALTIHNLKGNANINMSLDGNREISDMIYIKKAEGEYNIVLADAVTTGDIYANGLNGLRFATVGAGSNVKFRAGTYDKGFFNVEYEVGSDKYQGNKENGIYNGEEFDGEQGKVGNDGVDKFFEEKQDNTEDIALDKSKVTVQNEINETTNYKLVGRKGEDISDAGKTIINMSRANYDQAVYMDNLNKRLGEARYLDGDEGLWIRMRHDKIDKDNGYEINNNMYELGYDKKYDSKSKNGYHKRGVAIDYMNGDTSYDNIGSGETNRKGLWLYDTWIGNKGHYTDYVAKWGHLENSFDLYTKTAGEKVLGKYNNDVYSLSAEWGYKDQLNNDWYIEPQMQLQYAKVTGADYKTSQGTQVSLDGIDSLIARAGFRLGKDFGEKQKSTVYLKADILHEFLGDQDILVRDKTTDGNILTTGYDNNGTWYTVGLGFSTMLSDNSYAFLDVEKLFGNDHNNSYQINGGFNWLL